MGYCPFQGGPKLFTRRVWLDTLAAAVLALMAPAFMWLNLKGLSGQRTLSMDGLGLP